MMSELEIQTEVDGKVIKSKLSVDANELLTNFGERCADTMWALTEEAVRAVMPEGVNVASWTRRHGMHVEITQFPNRLRHQVIKDGCLAAEVMFKNGVIHSRIYMGRGAQVE